MTAVLDTSAALAMIYDEPGSRGVREVVREGAIMSTANLAEVVAKLLEKGFTEDDRRIAVAGLGTAFEPLSIAEALVSGQLRLATRHCGLSLGDRCCLALAIGRRAKVLTADRAWAGLDLGVEIEVIR
jgi:PIN domain nuclease of toxin-antitoxin system